MRKQILWLALASVLVLPVVAGAQDDRERTGSSSIDRHPQARPPKSPEQVMAGKSTTEQAKVLREADLDTRKAFAAYQGVVAEAQRDRDPTDAAAAEILAVPASSATREQIARFGADTDERAQQTQNIGRATQRALGKFQAALDREMALADAAGADARVAAYGQDILAKPASEPPVVAQDPQESSDQNN